MAKTPLDSHEKWLNLGIPSRNPNFDYPNIITKHIPLLDTIGIIIIVPLLGYYCWIIIPYYYSMKSHEIVDIPKKSRFSHFQMMIFPFFCPFKLRQKQGDFPASGRVATGRGDRSSRSLGSAGGASERQVLSAGAPVA